MSLNLIKNFFNEYIYLQIPYRVTDRRRGDIPAIWGDCSLAEKELGWKAQYGLKEMCKY